jgi:hypothetical protein
MIRSWRPFPRATWSEAPPILADGCGFRIWQANGLAPRAFFYVPEHGISATMQLSRVKLSYVYVLKRQRYLK